MEKIKLELNEKSVEDKIAEGKAIEENLQNDADTEVKEAGKALEDQTEALETTDTERTQLQKQAEGKTEELYKKEDNWDDSMRDASSKVQEVYKNNPAKWKELGFKTSDKPGPVGEMPRVENLSLTRGDKAGEVDAHWDPIRGARSYVPLISPDPVTDQSWIKLDPVTKSKTTVDVTTDEINMKSGDRAWMKIYAIGTAGAGPESDPATVIVP